MATAAQTRANRANGKHSTGPVTAAGKATSAQNHLKHGFRAQFRILHFEEPEEYATLLTALKNEHQPATLTETVLVERMAEHHWLSRRAQFLQSSLFSEVHPNKSTQKLFELYLRYQNANDRGFFKCLNELTKLRNERVKHEIGFERQKQRAADEIRKQEVNEARAMRTNQRNFDLYAKEFVRMCLPNHCTIPFSVLKTVLSDSIERFAAKLDTDPLLAETLQAA